MKSKIAFLSLMLMGSMAMAKDKDFSIESVSWKDGEVITDSHVFNGFGCSGQNISPQVSWKNLPKKAKSVTVTIFDPDAPSGSGWWHWVVYNIPTKVKALAPGEGKQNLAKLENGATQGNTDFGMTGYGGPCPPAGDKAHRYVLTVNALDIPTLELSDNSTAAMINFYINQHSIAKATITGMYSRSK